MTHVVLQKDQFQRLIRRRRRMGGDRHDEVWSGVYVMSPIADNEHQYLGGTLFTAIVAGLNNPDAMVFQGTNISNRAEMWQKNYRIPDVAVFLPGNPAKDRGTHWLGGPDFAVEVLSRGDRARKKFDFYAAVGVRELMLIERRPWRLELYRREGAAWIEVGRSSLEQPASLASESLGLRFRLVPGLPRPWVEVARTLDDRIWLA